jgi:hypothetical protein
MSEWVRLTPEDRKAIDDTILWYRRWPAAEYEHEITYGHKPQGWRASAMSNAELLALATTTGIWREVPEVRALAEAMTRFQFVEDDEGEFCADCGNAPRKGHRDDCSISAALAPVQEPADV